MLVGMNFRVETASSGEAAVRQVQLADQRRPFDLVLLDWLMPDMDGIETARRMQALPLHSQPRLLMVTAHGREEVLDAARQAGVDEVLLKPLNASQLLDTVVNTLAGRPGLLAAQRPEGVTALPDFSGKRVLLVEDNELNREVACGLLEESGLQIEQAEHGGRAVELLQAQPDGHFDLVLMDMQMPVLDGLAATRQLRAESRFAQLPIIAMTANAMPVDRERCLEAGMDDHLGKPLDPEQLWRTLARWLRVELPDAPDEAASEPALPAWNLPGVDLANGLRRVLGRTELYQRLLLKFAAGQKDFTERLRQALHQGEEETAERLTHSLKGLAGNLGAVDLQTQVALLESALKDVLVGDELNGLIEAVAQSVRALVQAIEAQWPGEVAATTEPVDSQTLAAVCQELAGLFAHDDPRAGRVFEAQAGLLRNAFDGDYPPLAEAVRCYDFEQALTLLRQTSEQRGLSL